MRDDERANRRRLKGRIAALRMHAYGRTNTAPARSSFLARFEREVDPGSVLSPEERRRRAEMLRRAYFTELALRPRRKRGEAKDGR
jgi:hypothetical protein